MTARVSSQMRQCGTFNNYFSQHNVLHPVRTEGPVFSPISVSVETIIAELSVSSVSKIDLSLSPASNTSFSVLEMSRCSPSKLNFNGGYNCTGDQYKYSCRLFCPPGIEFSAVPEPVYVCQYEIGNFDPPVVPRCEISSNMKITKSTYQTHSVRDFSSVDWSTIIFGKIFQQLFNVVVVVVVVSTLFLKNLRVPSASSG